MQSKPTYDELELKISELEQESAWCRQTEDALWKCKVRLNDVQRIAKIGSWEIDVKTYKRTWSDELFRIFGYEPGDFEPDSELVERHVHPDDLGLYLRQRSVAFKENEEVDYEYRIISKNGKVKTCRLIATIIQDRAGEPLQFLGTFQDITEHKRNKEEKLRLESQLRQAQKMEAIGTLAGGIAHDFNNLLSPIIGNAELALMDIDENMRIKINLEEILKAGHRAKDLVQQILTFSRQREKQEIPVRVSIIVKEISNLLRSTISKTIDIRYNLKSETDTVLADPTEIHQVVMNLCTNASYAMRERGGVLEIELEDLKIKNDPANKITNLPPGSYLRLTIRDTGYGIEREHMDKIFDPYFTTKGIGKGTGMGLAVVHGIVQNLGGDISVDSELGEGSSFQVLLPKFDTDIAEEKEHPDLPLSGNERILLVDDEMSAIDVIRRILERLGYDVTARTSSIEALEVFRNRPGTFDLVITDMAMPNMTGKALAKELMTIRPDIPIILCTGFSEQIDEREANEMGIRAFVMKPVVMNDLSYTIRFVLGEKR